MARALTLLLWAASAHAEVRLEGCQGVVDEDALRALLVIELGKSDEQVEVRCDGNQLWLSTGGRVSLAEVSPRLRPRTLALAIAEDLRRLHSEPPPAVILPSPEPISSPAPIAAPSPRPVVLVKATPPPNRRRLYGGLAIGLFSLSLATIAVGAPLTAIEPNDPSYDGTRIGGGAVMGIGAAAFTASVVTFALWLRERKR